MMGIGFQALEEVLAEQFKKKGEAVVAGEYRHRARRIRLRHREFQALCLAASHDREPAMRCSAGTPRWPWEAQPRA